MNESTDIYTTYNIDKSKLKRDYLTNPLKKINGIYEKPFKEDILYLYIELNLTRKNIAILFNVPEHTVKRFLKYYHIIKDKDNVYKNVKKSIYNKYGVENVFYSHQEQDRIKNIFTKKYGVSNPFMLKEVKEKVKQTNLERYGYEYPTQNNIVKEKRKKTTLERFGVENISQNEEIKQKIMKTMLQKGIYEKSISKEEQRCFNLLKTKFPDAKQQYYDKRYPYVCDFYIPSKDLFIEYQGVGGGHNGRPFLGTENDLKELAVLEQKNVEESYAYRVWHVWYIKDPMKRKRAKDNGLNYLEFFSEREFKEWFDKQ